MAVEEREISVGGIWKGMSSKPVVKEVRNFMYCFGGITFLLFLIQGITGAILAIYYKPTPELAYQSILFLENEVTMGAAMRSIHNISANLMVIMVMLHMLRVIYTGAYKHPREFNWVAGVLLLIIVFGFCFTGYLLPWDQVGYWAAVIGAKIMGTVPLIGSKLLLIVQGGSKVTGYTLMRFYILHICVLPVITIGLLIIHFYLVRKQGISGGL